MTDHGCDWPSVCAFPDCGCPAAYAEAPPEAEAPSPSFAHECTADVHGICPDCGHPHMDRIRELLAEYSDIRESWRSASFLGSVRSNIDTSTATQNPPSTDVSGRERQGES